MDRTESVAERYERIERGMPYETRLELKIDALLEAIPEALRLYGRSLVDFEAMLAEAEQRTEAAMRREGRQ